jgi:hypothetical protein
MSFLNSNKSPWSSYLSSVSSSSSSMSELDVEQSSSSTKEVHVLPKSDTLVWEIGPSGFPRLTDFTSSCWIVDYSSWSWSICIDDDEIFSSILVDDDILSLLESNISSSVFQRRFALSSKPYSILISSFISTLKALDKALDVWASRYRHFFCACVWEQSSNAWEKPISTIHQTWGFISRK